jgi:hypothetical protein
VSIDSWRPATKAQEAALQSTAELLLFGGSAGSLKSETICYDAIVERDNPYLRAIIFRQTFPQLSDIIDKTQRLYRPRGGSYNEQKKEWRFPSGAKVQLGYLETDADVYEYWGKEFTWIGFDESTMHTEKQIRTIISRLRSSHRERLRLRARLASNPGQAGASFHQQIFLHGACPVHEPEKCAAPGRIYTDRVWPSDGKLIPMSVAFIPGRLSDHNLLGPDYVEKLRMQEGTLADQLEQGCWCKLEGAYYGKIWNKAKMVLPYGSVGETYWWQFWIALDYGFGKSYAAAGLYVKTPAVEGFKNGRMFKIAEICIAMCPAHEFAQRVAEAFVVPLVNGQRRNIVAVYADPANFNKAYDLRIGTGGHSVADQINEVLAPYGIGCTQASNDRIGGWQLIYRLLQSGEFAFADTCPMASEAIRTRVHDEKRPGDVLKIPGDPLDDSADETRYGLYSFINSPEKPKDLARREAVQALVEARDLTSSAIRYSQMEQQDRYVQPATLGRRLNYRSRRM